MKHLDFKRFLATILIMTFVITPEIIFAQAEHMSLPVSDTVHKTITGVNTGQQTVATAHSTKELAIKSLEQVGAALAGQLLNKLTESTVNWINSGFEENPQYIENAGSFFKNVADVEVKAVVDQIGYDAKNFPFGKGVAVSLIKEYVNGQGSLKDKTTFTLDKTIGSNWKDFSTDFSKGGWKGLGAIIGNPANTPLGAYNIAKTELNNKINTATTKIDKELTRGQGFLDQKVCVKRKPGKNLGAAEQQAASGAHSDQTGSGDQEHGTSTGNNTNQNIDPLTPVGNTPVTGTNSNAVNIDPLTPVGNTPLTVTPNTSNPLSNLQPIAPTQAPSNPRMPYLSSLTDVAEKDCDQYKSLSPGSVVEASLNKALGSKTDNQALASVIGSLSSSIGAIANALTNQLVSKGLGALSGAGKKAPEQKEDTWSYNGYTLVPGKGAGQNGGVDYNQGRIIDLEELLITGAPDKTQIVTNQTTGETEVKVLTRKPTVLQRTIEEKNYYLKIAELVDGNKEKGIKSISEHTMALDYCLPGPDYNWELRVGNRFTRARSFLQRKAMGKNEKKADKANQVLDQLEGKESEIIRNIKSNMFEHNIPSFAKLYDQVQQTRRFALKVKEYYERYLDKVTTVAQLESIKREYLAIKANPNNTTTQIGDLLQRYAAIEAEVSTDSTYGEARDAYDKIKLGYNDLGTALVSCLGEKNATFSYTSSTGMSSNAWNDNNPQTDAGTLPPELAGITIQSIAPSAVATKLQSEFSVTPAKTSDLGGMTDDDIVYLYSIAKAYSTSTNIQSALGSSLSGDRLFDAIKAYLDNIVDYGTDAVTLTSETDYYCQKELEKTDTSNFWRRKDVRIKCSDIYHSNIYDYTIDKSLTGDLQ